MLYNLLLSAYLAPAAYLTPAAGSSDLVHHIVPPHFQSIPVPKLDDAMVRWSCGHDPPPSEGTAEQRQKTWDTINVSAAADILLEQAHDTRACASLLAHSTRESGAWLNVLPILSLGLCMDDDTIQVAVGL